MSQDQQNQNATDAARNTYTRRRIHGQWDLQFDARYQKKSLSGVLLPQNIQQQLNYWMKKPFWEKRILLFIGSPGLGKTDFFSRLGEWVGENFNNARYYLETSLLGKLKNDIAEGSGAWEINLKYLIDDEFIVLDDVARWAVKNGEFNPDRNEWAREVFQEFLDLRYNKRLPTVITSNLTRDQLKSLYGDRVASRLFATENTIIECFDSNLDLRSQGL